jgi:copper transport protein
MVSHSNALKYFSSLAVSIDWLHFIAISIWIGGLFYISTTILKKNKTSIKVNCENPSNINYEINNNINTINNDLSNINLVNIFFVYCYCISYNNWSYWVILGINSFTKLK